MRREIGSRQIQVECRLPVRLIHCIQLSLGVVSISGVKRPLLGRFVVLPIKNAVVPAVESVFELHGFLHIKENARAEVFPLASSGGVVAEHARIVNSRGGLLANLLAFLGLAVLPAGEVARREQLKNWLQR